jgi:VIT1/CCC1 family predicted Fe2+/Mn2+ transporter
MGYKGGMNEIPEHSHDPADIAARLATRPRASYLADAVFGAIDGAVTTFAVVAGSIGAHLSPRVVLILGAANIFADGFSMAAGNFIASRAALEDAARLRAMEERHIANDPKGETVEVREIYRRKGFGGEALDTITRLITSRHRAWIDTMLAEEHGLSIATRAPLKAALAIFAAFIVAGCVPLSPFALGLPNAATISTVATGTVFFVIGSIRSFWSMRPWWRSGLETFFLGFGAAIIAYLIGATIERLV